MKCPFCQRYIPIRSSKSNRFYWKYLEIISSETGDDVNSLHRYFKRAFLKPTTQLLLGKYVELEPTTTTLNPLEFSDYIKRIESETGIIAE